jgi:MscS family membrane protein
MFLEIKQFIITSAVCLIINFILTAGLKRVRPRNIWDKSLVQAVIMPANIALLLVYINYLLKLLEIYVAQQVVLDVINYIAHYGISIGFIIVTAWFLLRFVNDLEKNYFSVENKNSTLDMASSYILGKVIKSIIVIIAIIAILHAFDYNITTLLTVGGAGSVIIGFAAKDLLANFFGGLMVYLERPFKVGDIVKIASPALEGVVEKIGWRSTRIRNNDKRPVYIPNNLWVNNPVENISRMINSKIKEYISLRIEDLDKVTEIIKDIEQVLSNHPGIDQSQDVVVKLSGIGPGSLEIMINAFSKDTKFKNFMNTKQDIFFLTVKIVQKHHADFAISPNSFLSLNSSR